MFKIEIGHTIYLINNAENAINLFKTLSSSDQIGYKYIGENNSRVYHKVSDTARLEMTFHKNIVVHTQEEINNLIAKQKETNTSLGRNDGKEK